MIRGRESKNKSSRRKRAPYRNSSSGRSIKYKKRSRRDRNFVRLHSQTGQHLAGTGKPLKTQIPRTRIIEAERSEEHTSELQSQSNLVCRLLLEKKKKVNTFG